MRLLWLLQLLTRPGVPAQAFADSKFKGLRNWKTVFVQLRQAGTKTLPPAAAAAAAARRGGPLAALLGGGASTLLDVREPDVYAAAHATGALNVPLYSPMQAPSDSFDRLRQVYFALFGLRVPVRNEAFAAEVLRAVGRKDAPLILMCQTGGTLETAAERKVRAPTMPGPVYGKFGAVRLLKTPKQTVLWLRSPVSDYLRLACCALRRAARSWRRTSCSRRASRA